MGDLYISTDNVVTWTGLKDAETAAWVNDATVTMSLFKKTALAPGTEQANNLAEVQTLKPDAAATAGTWTLSYLGEKTSALAYNASTAAVQTALEALSNIESGDITVSGDTLDTSPVVDGMVFTWGNTLGDVSLLVFDFSSLTGPTQAGSTMTETMKGVLKGVAINEGGGKVGIPVIGNGLTAADYVRGEGFLNYNDEYSIFKAKENKIIIAETYAPETFTGNERIFVGMTDGVNINLPYVAASDGNYRGILPDTLKGMVEYSATQTFGELTTTGLFYLFIEAVKGASRTTKRIGLEAKYDS